MLCATPCVRRTRAGSGAMRHRTARPVYASALGCEGATTEAFPFSRVSRRVVGPTGPPAAGMFVVSVTPSLLSAPRGVEKCVQHSVRL